MLQPGLFPLVTSVNADAPVEYKNGFKNPSGFLPCAASWSLSNEKMLADIGVEQLVPATRPNSCWNAMIKFSPCAEMSGNARPCGLN